MIENGLGSRDVLPGAADALAATAIPSSASDRPASAPAATAPRIARLLAEEY